MWTCCDCGDEKKKTIGKCVHLHTSWDDQKVFEEKKSGISERAREEKSFFLPQSSRCMNTCQDRFDFGISLALRVTLVAKGGNFAIPYWHIPAHHRENSFHIVFFLSLAPFLSHSNITKDPDWKFLTKLSPQSMWLSFVTF